ncbi:MAG: cysteine methyltransferase [Alphaproteobacteria bacterium RIFCSPLOWO2_01_FULL_40_26]|nr:MAG: cysteine methyltransferase [Alphaproteobacteria bacterium RIFCSPHIGHO2_02_FULL_40_34]OFW94271.1 MAG: cysteine methyltransferase [Alphaproteobacteria bacterium RIFCSPLOWO2_01_FULL_40_26]OFX09840.1 MAG: cysteine methyltransferase [Alphaproteobacteria bacterium RIFCSPLOWO2_02_FULL_40_19]OFX11423.1 MAG: cysteine methyltransferase [Alphaproteobacteria bacterium RIFCSPLOWO2_12_FULL_40_11]
MTINAKKLYELLKKIPKGRVTTYGEIAKKLKTKAYRGVGQVVGANPDAPKTPCHRVVKSDGSIGGYAFGVKKKIALLASENVEVKAGKVIDFKKKLFKF